jgi:hypothetical protein
MDEEKLKDLEQRIAKWDDTDDTSDTFDLINCYLRLSSDAGWEFPGAFIDVAKVGRRLWGVMFPHEGAPDEDSPIDWILMGMAGQAEDFALSQVADRLGVSLLALQCALESITTTPAEFLEECCIKHQELTARDKESHS